MFAEDDIFIACEARSLMTVNILKALVTNLEFDQAFKIASQGFADYMIDYYQRVLSDTKEGSQERFDAFRHHYEECAARSSYCEIIESNSSKLCIRYVRCPFYEVLGKYGIASLGYAFCLSDNAFTEKVLPGVEFNRDRIITKGFDCCNHTWTFYNS